MNKQTLTLIAFIAIGALIPLTFHYIALIPVLIQKAMVGATLGAIIWKVNKDLGIINI